MMKTLKQIVAYCIWMFIALLMGILYMRIVLGPNETSTEGISYLLHIFYDFGLLYVGLIIGAIIALIFILLDVFYLKKKLKNNSRPTILRFGFFLVITGFVAVIHYVLEKVIDVI